MIENVEPHVGSPPEQDPVALNTPAVPQTDSEVKRKRGRPRKSPAPENESGENQKVPEKDASLPENAAEEQRIITIDGRRTVQTEADKQQNDLLDLIESLRSKRILTGRIQGVEGNSEADLRAIVYKGAFKVMIPVKLCISRPNDFREMRPYDVLKYQITKRLGAEVEYIVQGIDADNGVVVASRMEAMFHRRRQMYYGKDRDGNNLLYEGRVAEAKIMSVIRTGAFVELFGLETYIPLEELSHQRMADAMRHFSAGQRILVKIMELNRTDPDNIILTVSAKQVTKDPYAKAMQKHTVGNYYSGVVSVIHVGGIWVALDSGLDCLCNFPMKGRPPIGARVTVHLLSINEETNRLFGEIVYKAAVR